MIDVNYNETIEVSKPKYAELRRAFPGVLAFREDSGKYFIKLMIGKYQKTVFDFINKPNENSSNN